MNNQDDLFKFDRTAFKAATFEEADNYHRDHREFSVIQRLEIALYLTSIAYNFDIKNPPRVDRAIFSKAKIF